MKYHIPVWFPQQLTFIVDWEPDVDFKKYMRTSANLSD